MVGRNKASVLQDHCIPEKRLGRNHLRMEGRDLSPCQPQTSFGFAQCILCFLSRMSFQGGQENPGVTSAAMSRKDGISLVICRLNSYRRGRRLV